MKLNVDELTDLVFAKEIESNSKLNNAKHRMLIRQRIQDYIDCEAYGLLKLYLSEKGIDNSNIVVGDLIYKGVYRNVGYDINIHHVANNPIFVTVISNDSALPKGKIFKYATITELLNEWEYISD